MDGHLYIVLPTMDVLVVYNYWSSGDLRLMAQITLEAHQVCINGMISINISFIY